MTRAALYARVSTSEEAELQDPETQLIILRDYARSRGYDDVAEYVDRASGRSSANRPAFKEMIGRAMGKEIDVIIVLRLDRFMRDVVEGMDHCRKLQAAGCSLVLVRDAMLGQVDTSTPMGEFMLTTIFAVGQLERRLIAERTKEGIARHIKQQGEWGRKKRKDVNVQLAAELLKIKSLSETAELLGIPRTTLRDHLIRAGVEIPTAPPCRNTSPSETGPGSSTRAENGD
jgi:DNA invertase Pin-like site-specific DNA recombinase